MIEKAAGILTVLSISPNQDDHASLENIIGHSKWSLLTANNVFCGRALLLQRHDISVVLCEKDLNPGTWTDILKHIQAMSHPPSLIVTSRLADDFLWSRVLNEGGWDLLSKPFDKTEVLRGIRSAWQHWHHELERTMAPLKVRRAG